jgi:hypothetical protein
MYISTFTSQASPIMDHDRARNPGRDSDIFRSASTRFDKSTKLDIDLAVVARDYEERWKAHLYRESRFLGQYSTLYAPYTSARCVDSGTGIHVI